MPRRARKNRDDSASRRHGRIRRALLSALGAAVLIVGSYAIAGIYGGPWIIDRWLGAYLPRQPGSAGAARTIRFNPFTLVARITALQLQDPQTGATFAADRVLADLAAISLVRGRPVFHSLIIEAPRIAVASAADLSALGRLARTPPLDRSRIDGLELRGGTFAAGLGTDAPRELTRFDASLTGFDAGAGAAGRYRFAGVTAGGGNVESEGSLAANLERSDGRLSLSALELGATSGLGAAASELGAVTSGPGAAASGLGGTIDAIAPRGRLALSGLYSATSLLTRPRFEMSRARLEISELSLTPADGLTVGTSRASATASFTIESAGTTPALSGRVEADGARVLVDDARATPPQSFVLDDAVLRLTADPGNGALSLSLDGPIDGAGEATLSVRLPSGANAGRGVSVEAADLPAARLSAYALGALNRPLAAGVADLSLEYAVHDNRIDGSLRLVARNLAFAAESAPDRADHVDRGSLELAAALLETPDGTIELDLPFTGATGSVRDAVTAALRERVARLTEAPFDALAPLIGGPDAAAVTFLPGDAALGETAVAAIERLAGALTARPRLGVRVLGGYDPTLDRDALARQQIELHVQLATADPSARNRPAPVDLDSARVRDVLDEFAAERLPPRRVTDLAARYDCADAGPCERAYYEQVFEALVANEEIAPGTLSRLGRFRAQAIAEALAGEGIDAQRIEIAAGAGGVAVPVELTAAARGN